MIIKPGQDMNKITERIYIGNYHSAEMLDYGNRNSITHVLNCTPDYHRGLKNFTVNQINIDDGFEIPAEQVLFGIQKIAEAVRNGGTILVHCHAGISRSPGIVAAFLMYNGFSWDEAVDFIRIRRPQIFPHPRIASSIKKALGSAITPLTTLLGDK